MGERPCQCAAGEGNATSGREVKASPLCVETMLSYLEKVGAALRAGARPQQVFGIDSFTRRVSPGHSEGPPGPGDPYALGPQALVPGAAKNQYSS